MSRGGRGAGRPRHRPAPAAQRDSQQITAREYHRALKDAQEKIPERMEEDLAATRFWQFRKRKRIRQQADVRARMAADFEKPARISVQKRNYQRPYKGKLTRAERRRLAEQGRKRREGPRA